MLRTLGNSATRTAMCLALLWAWDPGRLPLGGLAAAEPPPPPVKPAELKPFHHNIVGAATYHKTHGGHGEMFAWKAAYHLNDWLPSYQISQDRSWLDSAVKVFDFLLDLRVAGPDGFKGWIGGGALWEDSLVGDGILYNQMLAFAELVLKDKTLVAVYGEAAKRYMAIFRRDFFEKWDARGTWHEDGPYGAYTQWDMFCNETDLTSWKKHPELRQVGVSQPFNKQNTAAECLLKLYRITGEAAPRARAQKIYAFMKSRMQLVDGYYVWNYWEPFGPWDVDLEKKITRHWMGTHPFRNYQAGEIGQIVEAYNTGVVFDQRDLEMILNTNLKAMWNQDKAAPRFANSNARLPANPQSPEEQKAAAEEAKKNVYSEGGKKSAGCLWSALCQFDQTIRDLYATQLQANKNAVAKAFFEKVTRQQPPSFARLHADLPVTVFDRPWSPCQSLTVAAVMPQSIGRDKPVVVICKAHHDIEVEVAVYSADGTQRQAVLHTGKIAGGTDGLVGVLVLTWDGTDPTSKMRLATGVYRVRWSVADGYREFPVTITE